MRYRVKKDFVLEGKLLAFGDSLFLQKAMYEEWQVYSFYTRDLVGRITTEQIGEYLDEDKKPPKERFDESKRNKFIKKNFILLFIFILPLRGITQSIGVEDIDCRPLYNTIKSDSTKQGSPIEWESKLVQVDDNIFELHVSAIIANGYFLYSLNERKKCKICPALRLEPNPDWELIEGPQLYCFNDKFRIPTSKKYYSPYCKVEVFRGLVEYIQVIRRIRSIKGSSVKGIIEYYPTRNDEVGSQKRFEFNHIFDEVDIYSSYDNHLPQGPHGKMVKTLTKKELKRYNRYVRKHGKD